MEPVLQRAWNDYASQRKCTTNHAELRNQETSPYPGNVLSSSRTIDIQGRRVADGEAR